MLGEAMYTTIKTLWDIHKNKAQIAQMTGHDWKTVAKVIKQIESGKDMPEKKPHSRKLDMYKEKILEWMEQDLNGPRIYEELKGIGIQIGYSTLKSYLANIRKRQEIFIRVHTAAGEEAQVDFGYVGLTPDNKGKRRKTWVFNMRLSYSRLDHYEKVYDQRVETFIQCHINAFKYFGGVPEYVKIDNLKAAILEANFYEPVYQQLYKAFADYYGFKPQPCRVRKPNDKGKVESGIKYVKNNFFLGRRFKDGDDVDRQLRNWLENTCNCRVHGTTRKVPKEVFTKQEREKLKPLPKEEFRIPKVGSRLVYHDCHVFIEYNYYSVPFEYVGKEVDIAIDKYLVKISYKNNQVAVHKRVKGTGEFKTNPSHYPRYKIYSDTEYQEKYQVKMADIGRYAQQIFFLILERQPRDWARTVKGILSLKKQYAVHIIDMACRRALAYNVHQYQIIRNICQNGSYNLPIEHNWEEPVYEYAKS